ncbi:MAG: NAD-dependent epimerase/dehydratase family protein [Gemmatimonadota bacterium]|nr:NAD-dependent epimerase/dehydratase family protein [Gemmatimonadota bacterium]
MRALVTGATGMVGRHIAERLLADGWTVRAMVRDPARAGDLAALGVDLARGDVLDQPTFVRAAAGCEIVFHAAAEIMTRGWERYRSVNIDGTRNAVSAAAAAHARLLQVSSVAVYGSATRYLGERQGMKTGEDLPLLPLHERAYYARSKRESEEVVLAAHHAGRIWAAAVRPDVIYGRHDRQFVPRIARFLRHGVVPLIAGGRSTLAVVHASAVADGAVRAATADAAGGRAYNLANDFDVTVREFFAYGARGLGREARFLPVPLWAAHGGLRTAKRAVRLLTLGRGRLGGSTAVDFLTRDNPFTSERARRELGWTPTVRPETGVTDAFAWWRAAQAGAGTRTGAA